MSNELYVILLTTILLLYILSKIIQYMFDNPTQRLVYAICLKKQGSKYTELKLFRDAGMALEYMESNKLYESKDIGWIRISITEKCYEPGLSDSFQRD